VIRREISGFFFFRLGRDFRFLFSQSFDDIRNAADLDFTVAD